MPTYTPPVADRWPMYWEWLRLPYMAPLCWLCGDWCGVSYPCLGTEILTCLHTSFSRTDSDVPHMGEAPTCKRKKK